jgi:hypothetical protein
MSYFENLGFRETRIARNNMARTLTSHRTLLAVHTGMGRLGHNYLQIGGITVGPDLILMVDDLAGA